MEGYLVTREEKIDYAIYLWVSDEEATKRLLLRAQKDLALTGKARVDEKPEIIKSRLAAFHETIDPILAYYKDKGVLLEIDGERPVAPIHDDIMLHLR